MATTSPTNNDTGVQPVTDGVVQSGFRVQLYAVAAGSYASNSNFGSGAAEIAGTSTAYDAVKNVALSRASVRREDTDVMFNLLITLDGSVANPVVNAGEVRVRVTQPLASEDFTRYIVALPTQDMNYSLPLFGDVEVLDETGTNLLPSTANTLLQARFLYGGDLALVQQDLSAGPPPTTSALTTAQLGGLFGVMGRTIRIFIRGTYRAFAPRN